MRHTPHCKKRGSVQEQKSGAPIFHKKKKKTGKEKDLGGARTCSLDEKDQLRPGEPGLKGKNSNSKARKADGNTITQQRQDMGRYKGQPKTTRWVGFSWAKG